MSIRFNCGQCGIGIKAPAERAGAELPCPKCGTTVIVPQQSENEADQFAELAASIEPTSAADPRGPTVPPVPPTPQPSASAQETPNPFQAPVASESVSYQSVGPGQVRIVDVRLRFGTVFRLVFQIWLAGMVFAFAAWIIMLLLALIFGIAGAGIGAF